MELMPHAQVSAGINNDIFHAFDLNSFMPGCQLLVNVSTLIVSLLSRSSEYEAHIVAQRVLSETEMRVLLPLLAAPQCCPQEVLQASYQCTYDFLVCALLYEDASTRLQWNGLIGEQRVRLSIAHAQSRQRAEMKNVYNALFTLRQKFKPLGFTIRARREGYYLASYLSH